jgi:hypothetical protein
MTVNVIFLIIILAIVVITIVAGFKQLRTKKPNPRSDKANPYLGMRNQFLSLTSDDLNLKIPDDQEIAFGVILELEFGDGAATIVSLSTGDASLYTSRGGGIIGGITKENVKNAAINLVSEAQQYFPKMNIANDTNIPKTGNIKIFILTNKNKYSYEAPEAEITNPQSYWAALFTKGDNLITQLRLTK